MLKVEPEQALAQALVLGESGSVRRTSRQLPLLLRPLIAASDTVSYTSTLFLPKNDVCCMTKRNLAKDGGKKHGTLSVQSPNLRGHSGHTVYSASPSRATFRSRTLTRGSPSIPNWRGVMCCAISLWTLSSLRLRALATRIGRAHV